MTESHFIKCTRRSCVILRTKGKLSLPLPTSAWTSAMFYKLQLWFFQPEKFRDSLVTYLITWLTSKWNGLQENQSPIQLRFCFLMWFCWLAQTYFLNTGRYTILSYCLQHLKLPVFKMNNLRIFQQNMGNFGGRLLLRFKVIRERWP